MMMPEAFTGNAHHKLDDHLLRSTSGGLYQSHVPPFKGELSPLGNNQRRSTEHNHMCLWCFGIFSNLPYLIHYDQWSDVDEPEATRTNHRTIFHVIRPRSRLIRPPVRHPTLYLVIDKMYSTRMTQDRDRRIKTDEDHYNSAIYKIQTKHNLWLPSSSCLSPGFLGTSSAAAAMEDN